jgi:hypothetical protein
MDEIVKHAMTKWPDVPHCFGWLALDARGNWRMRDNRAQALGLAGDRIRNATLQNFINRNYLGDAAGRWYFQNGPQRVYVDLEICPHVCRTDPAQGMLLHTGERMLQPDSAILTVEGDLVFDNSDTGSCAVLDNRDLGQGLALLQMEGMAPDEASLAGWMAAEHDALLTLDWQGRQLPVQRCLRAELPLRFNFVARPRTSD